MSYELSLNKEIPAIIATCIDHLSFDEIQTMDSEILAMLDASPSENTHLITDLRAVKSHPNNLVKVWSYTKPIATHKNIGTWIVVGANNPFTQFLIETISRLGKLSLKVVNTPEDAYALLSQTA